MIPFSLVGVDGNAFAIMGYVTRALSRTGLRDLIPEYQSEATSGNYYKLLAVSQDYIDKANRAAGLEVD